MKPTECPPVLLIAWRRPDVTRITLEAIRQARPRRLFVALDGPDEQARPGEADLVARTRAIIEEGIDWDCAVRHRRSTTNLGCRIGVSQAIEWFFEEVDEGIILEDDCAASPDFFSFCADLLPRFRNNPHVMCISGDNSAGIKPWGRRSYSFVRFPQVWGWATWRTAWRRYDQDLIRYLAARRSGDWNQLVPDPLVREVFTERLDRLATTGMPDTWDYQWAATLLLEHGFSIHPRVNLVQNIGFGSDATHTTQPTADRSVTPTPLPRPIVHPRSVRLHRATSKRLFLLTQTSRSKRRLLSRLRRRAKIARSLLRARLVPR